MRGKITTAFLTAILLLAIPVLAAAQEKSSATFYDKPAAWIFDLIKNPTSTNRFQSMEDGVLVGCVQFKLNDSILCTAHGKTIEVPKTAADAQLVVCVVSGEVVHATFGQDHSGSVGLSGPSGKSLFDLLPLSGSSFHNNLNKETTTQKTFGRSGTDGMICTEIIPDVVTAAHPATYTCNIAWAP